MDLSNRDSVLGMEGLRMLIAPIALTNIAGITSLINIAGTMNSVSPQSIRTLFFQIVHAYVL
jgi:hypothetical protein